MNTNHNNNRLSTEKKQHRIPLFCIVTMLYWFSFYIYVPFLSPYIKEMGASNKFIGIIIGSYGFTQMLLRIPLGILSDKLQKRKVFVILGVLIGTLSTIGFRVTSDPVWALFFRSMAGCAASFWVTYTILFSNYFKQSETSKPIGIISFFMSGGQMSAMLIGGYLAEIYNPGFAFLIGGIMGMVGIILSFSVIEKKFEKKPVKVVKLLKVGREYNVLVPSVFAILAQLITFSTTLGFTPVYAETIGATESQLGILTLLYSLSAAVASLNTGTLIVPKIGRKNTVISGFVIMAVFTFLTPFINNINLLYVSQIFVGLGRGPVFTVLMALSIQLVKNQKRGSAMGFFQSIYSVGMFTGPVLFGFISDMFGMAKGFYSIGVISLIPAVAAFFFLKPLVSNNE